MSETWCPRPEEIRQAIHQLERRKRVRRRWAWVLGVLLVLAAVIGTAWGVFVSGVYTVAGDAMAPTLSSGDVVLALRLRGEVQRGDMIVSNEPSPEGTPLIRRVIGLGGDEVSLYPATGAVSVNGNLLAESYVQALSMGNSNLGTDYRVPEGYLFVLGDNRAAAIDSRSSAVGMLPEASVTGRIARVLWKK